MKYFSAGKVHFNWKSLEIKDFGLETGKIYKIYIYSMITVELKWTFASVATGSAFWISDTEWPETSKMTPDDLWTLNMVSWMNRQEKLKQHVFQFPEIHCMFAELERNVAGTSGDFLITILPTQNLKSRISVRKINSL